MRERGWHVLLVDSDSTELAQIRGELEQNRIRVTAVSDEVDALHFLEQDLRVDAIILAIHAPDTDGVALLDAIRETKGWAGVSVFLLADFDQESVVLRSKGFEVERVLFRPFEIAQFLIAVGEKILKTSDLPMPRNGPRAGVSPDKGEAAPGAVEGSGKRITSDYNLGLGLELRNYWHILYRHKWILILVMLLAGGGALGISAMLTPKYEATSTIRIASAAGGQFDYGASLLATRLANTYVEIATTSPIQDELSRRLGVDQAPDVAVKVVPETELLKISARHSDPAVAQNAANTLAEIMVERSLSLYAGDVPTAVEILSQQIDRAKADLDQAIQDYAAELSQLPLDPASGGESGISEGDLEVLRQQVVLRQDLYADLLQRYEEIRITEQMRGNAITVVEPAGLPGKPVSPNLIFNTILGLCAGLVGGLLLIVLLESFDDSVADYDDIQDITGYRVIGRIPTVRALKRRGMGSAYNTGSGDAFDAIQARLQISQVVSHTDSPVILVTSPEPGAGKTTVAVNLARSMAQSGERVILVDADFLRPRLHYMFGLSKQCGLSDVLTGEAPLETALRPTAYDNLLVLTNGSTSYDVSGMLSIAKIGLVFRKLEGQYDYLIVDSPGLLSTGYTTLLAKQASAVILVVSQHVTDRRDARMVTQQLREVGARVVGVVINKATMPRRHQYYSRNGVSR